MKRSAAYGASNPRIQTSGRHVCAESHGTDWRKARLWSAYIVGAEAAPVEAAPDRHPEEA